MSISGGMSTFGECVPWTTQELISERAMAESKPLRIATSNLAHSAQDELHEHLTWDKRFPQVLSMIVHHSKSIDLLAVQELRNLKDPVTTFGRSVGDIVDNMGDKLGDFRQQTCFLNEYAWSHAVGIFYRKDRLRFVAARVESYGEPTVKNSSAMPRAFHVLSFLDLTTEMTFDVVNCFLPKKEDDKWLALEKLEQVVRRCDKRLICLGDFHFFDDLDGTKMRQCAAKFIGPDMAENIVSVESENVWKMSGTFFGFTHDPFCVDMTPDAEGNRYTRLTHVDHVFVRGFQHAPSAYGPVAQALRPKEAETIERDSYPTDQCMLYVQLDYV